MVLYFPSLSCALRGSVQRDSAATASAPDAMAHAIPGMLWARGATDLPEPVQIRFVGRQRAEGVRALL